MFHLTFVVDTEKDNYIYLFATLEQVKLTKLRLETEPEKSHHNIKIDKFPHFHLVSRNHS